MGKIIRKRYSLEFSIGILLFIFALSMFLSMQIFEIPQNQAARRQECLFWIRPH